MVLLHLPLEDVPHVLNRVQVWHTWPLHHLHRQQKGSCHLGGVFGVVMLGKQFLKGGLHLLLQNVTVHAVIHVFLNEPQLPSTSSSHAGPDHDATTTMLDCRQGTIFLVGVPGRHHTRWTPSESNKFTLDSSDHRTVYGVWSEHWQADLPHLQPLKQCWQHSCVCFLKPASAPDAQHKDSTYLIVPCEACSEWNQSCKTSVCPWPLYCDLCSRLLPDFL